MAARKGARPTATKIGRSTKGKITVKSGSLPECLPGLQCTPHWCGPVKLCVPTRPCLPDFCVPGEICTPGCTPLCKPDIIPPRVCLPHCKPLCAPIQTDVCQPVDSWQPPDICGPREIEVGSIKDQINDLVSAITELKKLVTAMKKKAR